MRCGGPLWSPSLRAIQIRGINLAQSDPFLAPIQTETPLPLSSSPAEKSGVGGGGGGRGIFDSEIQGFWYLQVCDKGLLLIIQSAHF